MNFIMLTGSPMSLGEFGIGFMALALAAVTGAGIAKGLLFVTCAAREYVEAWKADDET